MSKLILPGLIDPHVHLRDLGQTNKEDFYTGTCAALAGGFTTILDMPNNKLPITTVQRLDEKIEISRKKIVCDVGFYFGSMGDNLKEFRKVREKVFGLKLYLNQTTGNFLINNHLLKTIFTAWQKASDTTSLDSAGVKKEMPILVHAEDDMLNAVIKVIKKLGNTVHVCHISTIKDLKQIIKAKKQGLRITCGVTPHHLFLTEKDGKRLGAFGKMKPPLQTKKDQDFLWKNLKYIDVIESDHAPHTISEKIGVAKEEGFPTARTVKEHWREGLLLTGPQALNVPFGVPGLETTLPLLLTAVSEKRLTIDDIIRLCHTNPAKIFNIKTDPQTFVEVDPNWKFEIGNLKFHTKCGWSPFEGSRVKGKVQRVWIRGRKVFENGKILAKKGSGNIMSPPQAKSPRFRNNL